MDVFLCIPVASLSSLVTLSSFSRENFTFHSAHNFGVHLGLLDEAELQGRVRDNGAPLHYIHSHRRCIVLMKQDPVH